MSFWLRLNIKYNKGYIEFVREVYKRRPARRNRTKIEENAERRWRRRWRERETRFIIEQEGL